MEVSPTGGIDTEDLWARSSVAERRLCEAEAPGSNPGESITGSAAPGLNGVIVCVGRFKNSAHSY